MPWPRRASSPTSPWPGPPAGSVPWRRKRPSARPTAPRWAGTAAARPAPPPGSRPRSPACGATFEREHEAGHAARRGPVHAVVSPEGTAPPWPPCFAGPTVPPCRSPWTLRRLPRSGPVPLEFITRYREPAMPSIHFTDEHRMIRETIRRFVDEKVKPHGAHGSRRASCRARCCARWGSSASSRLRVPEALGGGGLDARASVVLAEEVGRSTHGGFAITVLVHTDMASPHLVRFGTGRQLEKYLPGIHGRNDHHRRRRHRARRRLRRGRHPHPGGARRRRLRTERRQDVHHQRRAWRPLLHRRPHRSRGQGSAAPSPCSSSRRARRASRSAGRSTRPAGAPPTPPSWSSRIAACRPRTCWASRIAASIRSWPTSRPNGW